MRRNVQALIAAIGLLAFGAIALTLARVWQQSPDLPPTTAQKVLQALALAGLTAVFAGSLAMAGAAISFCAEWPPLKLAQVGFAFLAFAGAVSAISRIFPAHTYAWVPVLMPWFAAIFAGTIMIVAAIVRSALSKKATSS